MGTLKTLVMSVACAAVAAGSIRGEDLVWTDWDGTGEMPTSGNVRLTWKSGGYDVVIDTEEEMTAVEGWDNLMFKADGSTYLTFANTTRPVTFRANVTGAAGAGTLRADGSCGLVLAGDNSARKVAFSFKNSRVTVAHEYGLGGADSSAVEVTYMSPSTTGGLWFHWDGENTFVNHCAIICDSDIPAGSYKDGQMYFGSSAVDEYFVQDADLYMKIPNAANKKIRFRNNFEQISGSFGIKEYSSNYFCTAGDAGAVVRFSGTTRFTTVNPKNAAQKGSWYILPGGRVNYYFGSTGGFYCNQIAANNANIFCDIDDPFRPDVLHPDVIGVTYLQPYANASPGNILNLNGHDATLPYINPNDAATESSTTYYCLTSAVPATLTLSAAEGQVTAGEKAGAFEVAGAASLVIDNHRSNIYACKVSRTTGSLTVNSGTLTYKWNGGWDGGAVTIAGGVVDAESVKSFAGGKAALTISSGSLNLHSGAPVSFAAATINGTELDPGDYTVKSLREDYALGDFVTGDDTAILAVGSSSEWTGWPSEPGATASVPKNTAVYIDDADVEKVGTVGKIILGVGSSVTCRNTKPLAVSAPISGYGEFRIKDISAGVTLSDDNSKLAAPGRFVIENSKVTVAHEFGLGSERTAAATIAYGAAGVIAFTNPDGPAFTNHVALVLSCNSGSPNQILGSESTDTYFVQANDLTVPKIDSYYKFYFKNNFEMISGTFKGADYGNGNFFSYSSGTAVIRFTEDAVVDLSVGSSLGSWYQLGASKLHFGQKTPVKAAMVTVNGTVLYTERDGVMSGLNTLGEYSSTTGTTIIDLCGTEQTVGILNTSYQFDPVSNPTYYGVIGGEAGSKLVLNGGALSARDVNVSFKVTDAVSLEMAWAGSAIRFRNFVSDSTGDLVVSAGTLGFTVNGGWSAGDVLVKGTGVLDIDSDKAFTGGTQKLTVRDDGKVIVRLGGAATFETLDLGGKTFDPDVYTIAQLKADPDVAKYVDGDDAAVITVNAVWHGWPTEPGATAFVPGGETVVLADTDVANVARLGKIVLGAGSTVQVRNATEALVLSAPVKGAGVIDILDSAGVTIFGDNSQLAAPGAFHIVNSPVAVSNEFGLGSVATGPTVVSFGTNGRLVFGNPNGPAFTNRVALTLSYASGSRNAILGSESPDETFVQANDVTVDLPNMISDYRLFFKNNFEMIAGAFKPVSHGSNWMFFTYTADGCDVSKVGFSGTATISLPGNGAWYSMGDTDFSMAQAGGNGIGAFVVHRTRLTFGAENALASVGALGDYASEDSFTDLNGFDQTVGALSTAYQYRPSTDPSRYSVITSAVPATLTVDGVGKTGVWTNEISTLFTGAVALEMAASSGAINLYNKKSDTTGGLIVSAGTVGIRNKAGWLGDVTVKGSGVLDIDAASLADGVFGTRSGATQTKTKINLADTGKLRLAAGTAFVDTVSTNGVLLLRGTYSAANCDWIEGEGILRARHGIPMGVVILVR